MKRATEKPTPMEALAKSIEAQVTACKERKNMLTLNGLLEITDVKVLTVYVHVTPRLKARIDVHTTRGKELEDVARLYGSYRVRRLSPAFKGDEHMVVELTDISNDQKGGTPNDQ